MRRALLALVLVAACSGDGGPATIRRDGAPIVVDPAPLQREEPVESYAITYRIEQVDGDDVRELEGRLVVARPFRSRFEVDRTVRVADFAYFGEREPGDETEIVTAVPTASPGDVRADVLELGEPIETREVAERRCEVHRFGASLLDGLFVEGDTVEACIDEIGLVLEEVTTVDGEIVLRRVATDVELAPAVDDSMFVIEGITPRSADDGGGSIQEVTPSSSPPGEFFVLDDAPPGFEHRGRYAMVPPQDARLDDEETRGQYVAGVVDVWVRGVDVLVVDQGGTLGQVPPFGTHPHGELVDDVGALGALGEIVRLPSGAEVRVLIPPGRYVKVSGTLEPDEVLAVARSLRATEGTELTYVDPSGPSED